MNAPWTVCDDCAGNGAHLNSRTLGLVCPCPCHTEPQVRTTFPAGAALVARGTVQHRHSAHRVWAEHQVPRDWRAELGVAA